MFCSQSCICCSACFADDVRAACSATAALVRRSWTLDTIGVPLLRCLISFLSEFMVCNDLLLPCRQMDMHLNTCCSGTIPSSLFVQHRCTAVSSLQAPTWCPPQSCPTGPVSAAEINKLLHTFSHLWRAPGQAQRSAVIGLWADHL